MKHLYSVFFIIAVVFFISGCSSKPSVSEGRTAAEKEVKEQSNDRVKLLNFEKTNGQEAEFMGVKVYNMEFTMEVECSESCYWDPLYGFAAGWATGTKLNAGQKAKFSGTITFQETENGWRGQLGMTKFLSNN